VNYQPTIANLNHIIDWEEGDDIAFTKNQVVKIAYAMLNARSGELYLPRPSSWTQGQPRSYGLRITADRGILVTNNKIRYFDAPKK